MELKYFRLIKTIAEEGSIANSSERLFLTQSALSHQLRSLEDRLGFKVFLRTRNQWQLTPEGQELYNLSLELLDRLDAGFRKIERLKSGSAGTIRVGAECQSFFHGLPGFVQKMGLLYPEINIDLKTGANCETVAQLRSGEIDVAIVTTAPAHDELWGVQVYQDKLVALMHQEHRLADHDYLEPHHFADVHLLINSFPIESVSVYQHFLRPHGVMPARISALAFTEVALEMVQANMGVLCIPRWMMRSFNLPEEVEVKKISKNGLMRTHYLVVKDENRKLAHIHDFVTNFQEEFFQP